MVLDLSIIWESALEMGAAFLALLPNIAVGIVVFLGFLLLAGLVRRVVKRLMGEAGLSQAAAEALSAIARWAVIIFGLFTALALIFPSVDVATILGGLGVGGVVIGFAFRDVLQNFFAGLILLITEPFVIGDQIVVGDYEGTIREIAIRATTLHTYDGRDVLIPNAVLFVDSVTVNTAHPHRRSQYDVGIGYGDDIGQARRLMLEAMQEVDEVLADPAPDVRVVDLADFSVNLRARWWTRSQRADEIAIQDQVLEAIKNKLVDNGIDLPFPTRQILFHDQTEETDGDRTRQREGWPAGNGHTPAPRPLSNRFQRSSE